MCATESSGDGISGSKGLVVSVLRLQRLRLRQVYFFPHGTAGRRGSLFQQPRHPSYCLPIRIPHTAHNTSWSELRHRHALHPALIFLSSFYDLSLPPAQSLMAALSGFKFTRFLFRTLCRLAEKLRVFSLEVGFCPSVHFSHCRFERLRVAAFQ